jgi:hypothetical protein
MRSRSALLLLVVLLSSCDSQVGGTSLESRGSDPGPSASTEPTRAAISKSQSATDEAHPEAQCAENGSARAPSADSPPQAFIAEYVSCVNSNSFDAAQSYLVDVGLPLPGTKIAFTPDGAVCDAHDQQRGMEANHYNFLVAVPGRLQVISSSGAKRSEQTSVIALRARGKDPWLILDAEPSVGDASRCKPAR